MTLIARTGTRSVILAEGPEGLEYLHGQLSQQLADLAVGETRWSFLLQPQGKFEAHLRVHRLTDDTLVMDTDPSVVDAALTSLDRFKLRTKVTFSRPDWSVLSLRGDDADSLDVAAVVSHSDVLGAWSGLDLLGPDVAVPGGVVEATADEWERARIAAGVPVAGLDLDERTIPQESGLVPASVSFTKGCYRGQELVERIAARGAVRRSLRRFELDGSAAVGEELRNADGGAVGLLTSVSTDSEGSVALGYVRTEAEGSTLLTESGVTVTIGGAVGTE